MAPIAGAHQAEGAAGTPSALFLTSLACGGGKGGGSSHAAGELDRRGAGAVVGLDVDQCHHALVALFAAGYSEIAIQIIPGQEHAIGDWGRVRRAFV
jgi:hypothetical protein